MSRRLNTLIIVPHDGAKFYKFAFRSRTMVLGAAGLTLGMVLAFGALGTATTALDRRSELARLEEENRQLLDTKQQLEEDMVDIQARLDEFEERTQRLALAAGLEESDELIFGIGSASDAGIGGPYNRIPDSPDQIAFQQKLVEKSLESIEEALNQRGSMLAGTPTMKPVNGVLTDGFGRRRDPFTRRWASHKGLDISARRGTPIYAPADGLIVSSGRETGYGKVVRISHGYGYTTLYGHMHQIEVASGQEVKRGDIIGLVGSTGRSTGPHLHYEVHVDGRPVNPLYYILDPA